MNNILLIYDYFRPAYKAGGPVQSLANLSDLLIKTGSNVSVITGCYDLNETKPLNVPVGEWKKTNGESVYYLPKEKQSYPSIKVLIEQSEPDVIYINGMFSLKFALLPLLVWSRNFRKSVKLVWAPRGMLQDGALNVKPFKKKVFLSLLKLTGLYKGVTWHATDPVEENDIRKHFGDGQRITVASNIPKKPLQKIVEIEKAKGELKLVYLSLISEKKNLHLALQWLNELNIPLSFDIYGPVKDETYWQQCRAIINSSSARVSINYKGDVLPEKVQDVFSNYHALLLPTKGENFGHAIFECLSVGRPVITSTATPWNGLEQKKAGFDIPLEKEDDFKNAILKLHAMDNTEYAQWCSNAHNVAKQYWEGQDFEAAYKELFKKN